MNIGLNGVEIRVAGAPEIGFLDVTNASDGSQFFSSGATVSILNDLQFIFNFSIKYIVVADFFPEPYDPLNNSTLSYQLITEKTDIAVGYLYYVLPRLVFGTPLIGISTEKFYAYFRQPTNIIEQRDIFLKPFKLDLVIAFLMLLSLIGILAEFSTISKTSFTNNYVLKVFKGIGWAFATISQQSYPLDPLRTTVKLTVLCGSFISSCLYAYYSAAIISYFVMDVDLIRTFAQLSESDYTITTLVGIKSSVFGASDYATDSTSKLLDLEYEQSFREVFQRAHAHVDSKDFFSIYAKEFGISDQDACKISTIPLNRGDIRTGFYARKGFLHKNLFRIGILKVVQSGLSKRYFTFNYIQKIVTCPSKVKKYHENLGFKEIRTVFYLNLILVCTAFSILLLEKLYYKYFKHNSWQA